MKTRWPLVLASLLALAVAAWLGTADSNKAPQPWREVAPGVLRSPGQPAGYALLDGDAALLIDAPAAADALRAHGVKTVELVLLTHHHRDSCARAADLLARRVPVRAAEAAAEWLTPAKVQQYWKESLPLRNSRTAYLVLAAGLDGIDCSLKDGQKIDWRGWSLEVVATPGHSRDHVAFAARRGRAGPQLLFCGDALAGDGTMWSPYTLDWDHWTDAGLKPAAESLRRLAARQPDLLLPAHGDVIAHEPAAALAHTAAVVEEIAFLKSFERFTKQRLGNAPSYPFLAREQAMSNGSLPWTKVSPSLWLTGNTYVLLSRDNAHLMIDPWGQRSVEQWEKLRKDQALGPLEVVLFTHAHYDHYDGVYDLPGRDRFRVWALDQVAGPIADPLRLRAPFLDARPVKFDERPKDGATLTWREYTFRFRHLPGQSEFTAGMETTIDGKRCYFTADNFFHQDMFSGSGGWMGLNRSYPLPYAASAQKVLDAAPDWVLAEHGGPFEFNAEDFRRRVRWGQVSALAADAVCVSGQHRRDWDPHRVRVEPLLRVAKAGAVLDATLVIDNPSARAEKLTVTLEGGGLTADQTVEVEVPAQGTARRELRVPLGERVTAGRHILPLRAVRGDVVDGADAFLGVDVTP